MIWTIIAISMSVGLILMTMSALYLKKLLQEKTTEFITALNLLDKYNNLCRLTFKKAQDLEKKVEELQLTIMSMEMNKKGGE